MPLTDMALRHAKPRDREYKLFDGGGLHLLVRPNGSKLWRLAYRFAGKPQQVGFGAYPLLGLNDARQSRDDAKRLLKSGLDPRDNRKPLASANPSAETFEKVAREFIQRLKDESKATSTVEKNEWMLLALASDLGPRPVAEIKAAEVLAVLKRVERSGRRETARRLRSTIGSVFRFAVATLRAENDPTAVLRGALTPPVVTSRAAITDPKKLGGLMCAIDEYDGWPTLRACLQLLALTFTRPGESRLAEWKEIDSNKATWTVPAARTKMRRPLDVPLSRQALELLADVHKYSGRGKLIFPAIRSDVKPLSENALNSALRRMGFTKEEMTAHGFRASASTILHEKEFAHDVIETQLAHLVGTDTSRAYNRALYWKQRVAMMQSWADLLDEFRKMGVK